MKKYLTIFGPLIGGSIIGLITRKSMDLDYLIQPPFTPPKIVFPIAWTIIYFLLGLSYYLHNKKNGNNKELDIVYYSGLIINYLWSILFFTLKLRFFSILWIFLLDGIVIYLQSIFLKENKTSFYLNIPYMIWLIIATYLTIGIFLLN